MVCFRKPRNKSHNIVSRVDSRPKTSHVYVLCVCVSESMHCDAEMRSKSEPDWADAGQRVNSVVCYVCDWMVGGDAEWPTEVGSGPPKTLACDIAVDKRQPNDIMSQCGILAEYLCCREYVSRLVLWPLGARVLLLKTLFGVTRPYRMIFRFGVCIVNWTVCAVLQYGHHLQSIIICNTWDARTMQLDILICAANENWKYWKL